MRLIDTHAHLEIDKLNKILDKVIQGAQEAGLIGILTASVWLDTAPIVLEIAKKYKNFVFPCLGFAPTEVKNKPVNFEPFVKFVKENYTKMVGLGEIGLDYHWILDKEVRKEVEKRFVELIQLGNELNKPIVIHCRDAELRTIELLEEYCASDKVHMHCFSGDVNLIRRCLKNGWYFSVPASLMSAKRPYYKKLAEKVPLDRMFLETDAPFQSPPKTKYPNEPKNISISVAQIARIKNTSTTNVAETTTNNAIEFYSLPL